MPPRVRDIIGSILVFVALTTLYYGVTQLRLRDYLGAVILVMAGLSMMRAGVDLLRSALGE